MTMSNTSSMRSVRSGPLASVHDDGVARGGADVAAGGGEPDVVAARLGGGRQCQRDRPAGGPAGEAPGDVRAVGVAGRLKPDPVTTGRGGDPAEGDGEVAPRGDRRGTSGDRGARGRGVHGDGVARGGADVGVVEEEPDVVAARRGGGRHCQRDRPAGGPSSEEHTAELQSPYALVCRLLPV